VASSSVALGNGGSRSSGSGGLDGSGQELRFLFATRHVFSDSFFNQHYLRVFFGCPVSKLVILQHLLSKMYFSHPSPFSLRPHLQRDSARAEESSPANLSRSRRFGGGDELFGSFVEFEGILKR